MQEYDLLMCKTDPWYFISNYCVLHDPKDDANPYRKFPDYKYLEVMTRIAQHEDLIWCEKSRQILITWWGIAYFCIWDCLFHEGRLGLVMSKKEEFANEVLIRAEHVHSRLPEYLKDPAFKRVDCELLFPSTNSRVKAATANPDDPRSLTYSWVWCDEDEFQEEPEETYGAAKPTLKKYLATSSVNGKGFKYRMMYDTGFVSDSWMESLPKINGMQVRRNKRGFCVVSLHYSANPERTPEWAALEKPNYTENQWQREFELNREVIEGERVYPQFDRATNARSLMYLPERPIVRSWDFGFLRPAVVWLQVNGDDQVMVLAELTPYEVTVDELYKLVIQKQNQLFRLNGRIHTDYIDFGDPAGHQRSDKAVMRSVNDENTTISVLRSYGIRVQTERYETLVGVNLIRKLLLRRRDGRVGMMIDPQECPMLLQGFLGGYVLEQKATQNEPEEKPKKDKYYEDVFDAMRYGVTGVINPENEKIRTTRAYSNISNNSVAQSTLYKLLSCRNPANPDGRSSVTGY